MTDISAFPTIRNVLYSGDNIITLTATNALTAGMVVEIDADGVRAVNAAVAESGSRPVGVSIYDVAAGGKAAIATYGCVCYVANADTATMDAGTYVVPT